jgi:thermitase
MKKRITKSHIRHKSVKKVKRRRSTLYRQRGIIAFTNKKVLIIVAVLVIILLLVLFIIISNKKQPKKVKNTVIPYNTEEATPTITPTPTPSKDWTQGEINVKFKPGVDDATIQSHIAKYHASIKSHIPQLGVTLLTVPPGQEQIIQQALSQDDIVQYAEPNYKYKLNYIPKDPDFTKQWYLKNTGQLAGEVKKQSPKPGTPGDDVGAEKAWDITKGNGVKIAVVDTGIDLTSLEFNGKLLATKSFTSPTVQDVWGHGTHVAGIVAAPNNDLGTIGVCPGCRLIIAKVMDGEGDDATISQGIIWSADQGAQVISMSFGNYFRAQLMRDAVDYALSKGALPVVAAGNDNTNKFSYPAAYPEVLSVAATDNTDVKADFSNWDPDWVDVAAPGVGIYSTTPSGPFGLNKADPLITHTFSNMDGTSMATPLVAGVAGLVWSTKYGTNPQDVKSRIEGTAKKIDGTGKYWKYGRVDAFKAVGGQEETKNDPIFYCMRLGEGGCAN